MIGNSHNSSGSFTRARKQTPRWRSVFIALVFALGIGGVGQTALAQDGGVIPVRTNTSILAYISPQEVCVGEYATIRVQVVRQRSPIRPQAGFGGAQREQRMVAVNATVTDSSIASLGTDGTRQVLSADSDVPGQVEYLIHGEAEGSTEVVFTTDEMDRLPDETFDDKPGGWFTADTVSKAVPVKVKNCEYMVDLTSNWSIPGEAHVKVEARFVGEKLERTDAAGLSYTGDATVKWKLSISKVRDCEAQNLSWESNARLDGQKDNDGARIVVNLTFEPMTRSLPVKCERDGETIDTSFDISMTAAGLRIAAPSDTGGGSSQSHELKGPETAMGTAFIRVYPSNMKK